MNKTDLIGEVAEKTQMTKKEVEKTVNAFFRTIEDSLKSGDKIQLVGFGAFEVRERQARKGRNPQNGQEIDIPATKVPAFKAGKKLKQSVQS